LIPGLLCLTAFEFLVSLSIASVLIPLTIAELAAAVLAISL
jgi:hypothetical protein